MEPNINDLIAQREQINIAIAQLQNARRETALVQARALIVEFGLTRAELFSGKPAGARRGRKAAAKYRDPATGREWSGRGLQPHWLRAAVASGRSADEFLVKRV